MGSLAINRSRSCALSNPELALAIRFSTRVNMTLAVCAICGCRARRRRRQQQVRVVFCTALRRSRIRGTAQALTNQSLRLHGRGNRRAAPPGAV
ncbi:MAG: hypothetical protein ABL900_03980 [Burkholderiaceae bacterium]